MAIIFTFSRPSAPNIRPTIPDVPRMFWPTTVTSATVGSRLMCSTFSCARSGANSRRSASTVRLATEAETTRQMSFCDDDCEISSTSARSDVVVSNVRPRTCGTLAIPGPPTVIRATSLIAVSAMTREATSFSVFPSGTCAPAASRTKTTGRASSETPIGEAA